MDQNFLPEHLEDYSKLVQNVRGELSSLTSKEKGERFERFVRGIVPETGIGNNFETPNLRGRTGDEGVDLIATSKDGKHKLFIQSKLWIDRVEDIDQIMRKFQEWLNNNYGTPKSGQLKLSFFDEVDPLPPAYFMVVTLSSINNLLERYSRKSIANDFYQAWLDNQRLIFIDGEEILKILQADFIKQHDTPTSISLNLEIPPIRKGNVYISILSSEVIRDLYRSYGNALFFENVRDFQGMADDDREGRTTPNREMVRTIRQNPEKLLERNNGIVFKAKKVTQGNSEKQIILEEGSIVNGCQTTTCVAEYSENPCHVLVKIVEATDVDDQWEVAQAANYQNKISYIDLKLARSVRPQIVERAAAVAKLVVDRNEKSAFQVMDEIYNRRVAYDEIRLLYIGLFSKKPNNVMTGNYTELDYHLIDQFYGHDPYGKMIFDALFELQRVSQDGIVQAKNTFDNPQYKKIFDGYYKDGYQYRAFVTLLAVCALFANNIEVDSEDVQARFIQRKNFLAKIQKEIEGRKEEFLNYYTLAVKVWMDLVWADDENEDKIRRQMNSRTRQSSFTALYRRILSELDVYLRLSKNSK